MAESEKLYLRQVHPKFFQGQKISHQVFDITSVVFTPSPKDEGELSVYNGVKFTGESSFDHYTKQGFQSAGVVSVSEEECNGHSLNVIDNNEPFDGHSYIDYKPHEQRKWTKIAQKLKFHAIARGWSYNPNLNTELGENSTQQTPFENEMVDGNSSDKDVNSTQK